jgi:cbb3-type cytochrome c oxidase subunit III
VEKLKILLVCLILLLPLVPAAANEKDDTTPSLELGASVFSKRCVLCHGSQGMGEGKMPLKINSYPNTNIVAAKKAQSKAEIHEVITYGGMLPNISNYMPPMGNELTWTELESVAEFVFQLRIMPEKHYTMLQQYSGTMESDLGLGLSVFQSRCVLCHGANGEGDGRMSKVITSPPPFNLTKSQVPAEYIKLIIEKGGEAIGRSGQMPPWGGQLSNKEVNAVTSYIISLRK